MTEVTQESLRPTERISEEIANLKHLTLFTHEQIIKETGGKPGVWSQANLESAVVAPFATFGGQDIHFGVFDKSAVLMRSLIQNHPFEDGNKRTGFIMTLLFLLERGYGLRKKLHDDEIVEFCVSVAKNEIKLAEIATWLKSNSTKATASDFIKLYKGTLMRLANA